MRAAVKLSTTTLTVRTRGPSLVDITPDIVRWLEKERAGDGQLTLFIRHTSASLTIQENADPDVLTDLEAFMRRLAPWTESLYAHRTEGPDDMPAHIRAALTNTSLSIPVIGGRMALGTWQTVYVWEHRAAGQERQVVAQLLST
jgi:secondary thiamine-phosphate synthase enzyme